MLRTTELGTGPAVLLLHGLPSPPAELVRLGATLHGRRVLVPSMPGYAGAPPAPGRQDIASIECAILALLAERGVAEVDVVGTSMGAYRAIRLALSGRVVVRSLALLGAFAGLSAEERDAMRGLAGALRGGVDLSGVLAPRMLSKAAVTEPAFVSAVEEWLSLAPPEVLIEELEDLADAVSLPHRTAEDRETAAATHTQNVTRCGITAAPTSRCEPRDSLLPCEVSRDAARDPHRATLRTWFPPIVDR